MTEKDDALMARALREEPRLRQVEHGPRTGETILFLHGGSSAGWTWLGQVEGMPDRHVLTPDHPGYAGRADERWPGVVGAADDAAALIRERAIDGRAHLVGLSLGGFVATHLVHGHPELVRSCIITGSALTGYSPIERTVVRAQLPLWRRRWYWRAQAFAFRLPAEARLPFAIDGAAPSAETNAAMFRDVTTNSVPADPFAYDRPFLAVSGERDTASIRRAFGEIGRVLPQTQTWIAPQMHHAWNVEDPDLFTRMVTTFADTGQWEGV